MNRNQPFWKQGIILIITLIIGILIGRWILGLNQSHVADTSTAQSATTTASAVSSTTPVVQTQATPATSSDDIAACVTNMKKNVAVNHTDYDKGTIIVTFVQGTTFDQATSELSQYGLTVNENQDAQTTFPSSRLVTATVPAGQEMNKVCIVRKDALVYYAGLNTVFSLHE